MAKHKPGSLFIIDDEGRFNRVKDRGIIEYEGIQTNELYKQHLAYKALNSLVERFLIDNVVNTLEDKESGLGMVKVVHNKEWYNCILNEKGYIINVTPTVLVDDIPMTVLNGCYKVVNNKVVLDEEEHRKRVMEL